MPTIALRLMTYNESLFLRPSLETVLPYVDQAVIADGGPDGPSTDGTLDILEELSQQYPLQYTTGTYLNDDGSWDEMRQANSILDLIDTDFVMLHHADIIYDIEDMAKIRDAVDKYPEKKIFYCDLIEFFFDMYHIRLYPNTVETLLCKPLTGDVPIISNKMDLHYVGNAVLDHSGFDIHEALFMPHVKRFHFGWVKSFPEQVAKHIKYMKHVRRDPALLALGEDAIRAWAIEHASSYLNDLSMFDYYGDYPRIVKDLDLMEMCSLDGYKLVGSIK